jgi:hypothetical protein
MSAFKDGYTPAVRARSQDYDQARRESATTDAEFSPRKQQSVSWSTEELPPAMGIQDSHLRWRREGVRRLGSYALLAKALIG